MTDILAFIAAHMSFLWDQARFHVTGSEVTSTNGGNAVLLVESDILRLRFVQDRGQLLLDFQPVWDETSREWYSVDLIRRLFVGMPETSGLLDEGYAAFIEKHLDAIEDRFRKAAWPTTRAELKRLEVQRAQEMFG